jgi:hypothetical protein
MLRRNATEENAWVLNEWEWIQIALSAGVFFLAVFGDWPARSAFGLIPAMLLITVMQLAFVTPHIASLVREVEEIPVSELLSSIPAGRLDAFNKAFWAGEALKMLFGMSLMWKLRCAGSARGRPIAKRRQALRMWHKTRRNPRSAFGGAELLNLNRADGV